MYVFVFIIFVLLSVLIATIHFQRLKNTNIIIIILCIVLYSIFGVFGESCDMIKNYVFLGLLCMNSKGVTLGKELKSLSQVLV